MSNHDDPYDLLVALRPQTSVDESWPAEQRTAALERIMAAGPEPDRRPRRRLRAVIVAAFCVGVLGAGAGVAGAARWMPEGLRYTVGMWADAGVDPQRAERIGAMPGPDGTVLTAWQATNDDDMECITTGFEAAAEAAKVMPESFQDRIGMCIRPDPLVFAETVGLSNDQPETVFVLSAGTAVRAEVRLAGGRTVPATAAGRMLFGWFTTPAAAGEQILIGYDANGREVGRYDLRKLN